MKNNIKIFIFILLVSVINLFAQTATQSFDPLLTTVNNVCYSLRSLLPPLSMLMLIGAGVVYIGGQFTGAETRSRANVWATNLLIGALIGLLIAAVAPVALESLSKSAGGPGSQGTTDFCKQII
ncbi:MAG: hypothetical protein QXO21_02630 [Candidatus Anstonellales archaeon]